MVANLFGGNVYSGTANFETHFKDGLSKFENSKFEEAKKSFEDALLEDSNNVAALVNLGLSAWHLNQKGSALGFIRRALYLNPSDASAILALEFINEKFQVREIPHTNSIWENFRQNILLKLPLPFLLSAALITFFIGAWFMIENVARRKKALGEDLVPPSFSWISAIILIISLKLWVLS